MVFDLKTANNLPQSSTSSCTDYFYDGCHSKSQNNCHIQYQNCQCRPCCINSVINDHTYSLLKKICRKVFRDYNRQKSREKYTIFDGGNSVNVRIHRSSFVPGEDGKCKPLHADSSLSTLGGTRRKYGKDRDRKDDNISEKSGKGAGIRKNGEKGRFRRSDEIIDTKRDRKKRGQDNEDEKYGKGRKGKEKGKGYDDDSDDTKRRQKRRGKGDDDDYYGDSKKKKEKIGKSKLTEDGEKRSASQSGKATSGRKKYGVHGDGDRKDSESLDDKISKKKSDKMKKNRGSEDNDYDSSRNIEKLDKRSKKRDGDKESRTGAKEGKNKQQRGSKEDEKRSKDRDGGKMRDGVSRDDGKDSRDRDYQGNTSKDAGKSSRDREAQNKDGVNKGDYGPKGENKSGKERDHQDKVGKIMRYKDNRYSSTRYDHNGSKSGGYRDNQMKGSKYGEQRDDRYSSARKDHDADRKRKDVADLPVISDLRTKVRKGHDVMSVRKSRIGANGYRSSALKEGGRKRKVSKHGLIKGSKDRINERFGTRRRRKSRSGRGRRTHFGTYRGYGIGVSSRCDEIRPCDILRAHMEQRELCERRRNCCLQCSCDCSAVYCPVPSTICSRLC
uniref:Uncharacterized protein n=1 Tax=Zeugodacus cucurbitae TaxID=28588 RepID=A0A0A1XFD0_ZEUCU